jgi:hypothetical protein
MKAVASDELFDDLNRDILALAWGIGPVTWIRCKKILSERRDEKLAREIDVEMDGFLDRMIQELQKTGAQTTKTG